MKNFQGELCAVLKTVFDISGKTDPDNESVPSDVHIKGEALSHRSLVNRCELETQLKGDLTMDCQTKPQTHVHIEGVSDMIQKITWKKGR